MDVNDVARIGLLFLDGDAFENALIDKTGATDYDFDQFNRVKHTLLNIEMIAPELNLAAICWKRYWFDSNAVIPLIAGRSLPVEGCKRRLGHASLMSVFETGEANTYERASGTTSHYYAFYNSDGEIAGCLELLSGLREWKDVSYLDMFFSPELPDDE